MSNLDKFLSGSNDEYIDENRFLLVTSASGRVLLTTSKLTNYIEEELQGRNLNDFIPDDKVAEIIASSAQETEFRFDFTVNSRHFDCISNKSGNQIKITLFPRNLPGDGFISKKSVELITGEVNNSLTVMSAVISSIKNKLPEDDAQSIGILNNHIMRMFRLSRNLLDYSLSINGELRINPLRTNMCNLVREIGSLISETVAPELDIDFTYKIPDEDIFCNVDAEKIQRMIYNLLSNSMNALDSKRKIELVLERKKGGLAITIRDSGTNGEYINDVFSKQGFLSPGEISGWRGAGIGLALVRAYAKAHGGSFVIAGSSKGSAACVTLRESTAEDSPPHGVSTLTPDYAGGFSLYKVELSTVLGKHHYV